MYVRNKKGFTLVELLAVLVILAVILVIAVPKVMSIIKDVRISTLESTAKLVALSAEKKKIENEIIGNNEILTCENVVKINDIDYESCYIEFIDNKAVVTIIGKGTFKGMNACEATKTNANITERCLNKKVEITLELNGGSAPDITGIYKEGTILDLEEPVKENGTFTSYKVVNGNSVITNNKLTVGSTNTIIHAEYESWPSLEIELDGGNDTIDYKEVYKSGSIIELEVPTKIGYTFTGWKVESGNGIISGNTLTMGSIDTIIKANYELSTYKLSFNPNGGIIDTTYKNITYSDTYGEMPTPVKEGCMFIGWYNEDDIEVISTDKVEILNDIELTAKYIKNEFEYTGEFQTFIVPKDGNYKIELWGAEGGGYSDGMGGKGAYTSGIILLSQDDKIYINIGEKGKKADSSGTIVSGGYNGGGGAYFEAGTGGGSSDIRINGKNIIDRIMIAAGGGGSGMFSETMYGGDAGGLKGYDGVSHVSETYTDRHSGEGASQTSGGLAGKYWTGEKRENSYLGTNGNLGIGGIGGYEINNSETSGYKNGAGAGGGGYYGGGGGTERNGAGGGGSSFISGHNGCNAISGNSTQNNPIHTGQSIHFSGYKFSNTIMIDGKGYNWTNEKGNYIGMPSYDSKSIITGNIGNGYAKITYIGRE